MGKLEGNRPFGRPRRRGSRYYSGPLRGEMGVGRDRIDLVQDKNRWRVLVNAVMYLWVP